MALPKVLADLGVDPAEVLAEFGLAPVYFQEPEHVLPMAEFGTLMRRCMERTRCGHFPLLVGQHAGAQSMGAVGYLMLSSPTVGAALEVLANHLSVHDRGAVVAARAEGGYVSLSYSIVQRGIEDVEPILAAAMSVGRGIMRGLCGPDWRPHAVTFAFARPRDVEFYRRFFGVAPRFDASETALIFPQRLLDRPLASADVLLHRLMTQRIEELDHQATADVAERVRRLLRVMIASADSSLATVAQQMGVHERTLKRRLAGAGTSFQAIRDDIRFETARQLLAGTHVPVGEIATIVGYSDPSTFTRAFQRWAGIAPLEWRVAEARRGTRG